MALTIVIIFRKLRIAQKDGEGRWGPARNERGGQNRDGTGRVLTISTGEA